MTDTLLLGLRVALSLAVVLAVLWFIARQLNGKGAVTRKVPITVLGRQNLNRRASMTVVEVGGRTLVLGVTEAGVRLLTELDDADIVSALPGEDDDESRPTRTVAQAVAGAVPTGGPTSTLTSTGTLGSADRSAPADAGPVRTGTDAGAVRTGTGTDAGTVHTDAGPGRPGTTQAFSDVLAAEATGRLAAVPGRRTVRAKGRRQAAGVHPVDSSGPLAGSILDKATWQTALATIRSRQHRTSAR